MGLLRLMCRRHHVVLCCPTSVPAENLPVSQRYADQLRALGVRVPKLKRKTTEDDRFWFHRNIKQHSYEVILFELWNAAWGHLAIARAFQPWAKLIVDSVDVHFLRETAEMDFRPLGPDQRATLSRNQQQELQTYRAADAVVVVTAEDQVALAAYPGMPKLYRLPIIVPIRDRSPGPRRPEILFVGGFKHAPNVDGIVWFVQEAWPSVKAAVPEAELTIIGNRPTPEVQALGQVAGVTVVGYVPETDPYLDRAAVVIAPLRYGAGMKGKVAEALACGAAVVTTTIGNQGFGAVSNEHLLLSDAPAEFAAQVVALLRDSSRAERLGQAGRDLVARICAPEVVGHDLERLLAEVASQVQPTLGQQFRSWCEVAGFAAQQAVRLPLALPPIRKAWRSLRPYPPKR
ncbi:MAG: glycosyltransferase [Isosphaeraceae bacterium]